MPPQVAGPYLVQVELLRDRMPSFEAFPFCVPAIRHLQSMPFHPQVTFLVGENGSGKSTLLEALAVLYKLNPEGGSRNFNFASKETHSMLDRCLRLGRTMYLAKDAFFLRAESFYNVATEVDRLGLDKERYYGGKSLHAQSYGEAFFTLFEKRFHGSGLYLLDEPEAALSPNRQLQFLALMHDYCRRGAQFVIATHSPIIMAYPQATIQLLDESGIHEVPYEETEHFKVARAFLSNRKKMLRMLLEEE